MLTTAMLTLSACAIDNLSYNSMRIGGGPISATFELYAVTDTCMIEEKPYNYINNQVVFR